MTFLRRYGARCKTVANCNCLFRQNNVSPAIFIQFESEAQRLANFPFIFFYVYYVFLFGVVLIRTQKTLTLGQYKQRMEFLLRRDGYK